MYLLRLRAIVNGQPQINKQVAVYYADGNTPAVLYNPTTEVAIGNQLKTDASGFILFKIVSLTTLTFRTLTGLTLSPAAYSLYTDSSTPTPLPPLNTEIQLPCAETIIAGQVVSIDPILNQFRLASAAVGSDITKVVGVALQSGNVGQVIRVITNNIFYSATFNFTYPAPIFLGANGTLTQNPTGLAFRQQIGMAVSPTQFNIQIGLPIKRL